MGLRTDAAGKTTQPCTSIYTWKDYALYAMGVGAGTRDLRYLLEDPLPDVLPTFGVIPSFGPVFSLLREIGGDLVNLLHNSQVVHNHAPWPFDTPVSTTATVAGIWDMKIGAMVEIASTTVGPGQEPIAETSWQLLLRGEGGFGGPRPPSLLRAKVPRDVAPVLESEVETLEVQALLYRLSGDINPIHAKPEVAGRAGFERPILHGLCTLGIAGRVVLRELYNGDPMRIAAIHGRFIKIVYPGDMLLVRAYEVEDSVIFNVEVPERREQVLIGKIETRQDP